MPAEQERRALAHHRVRRGAGGRDAAAGAGLVSSEKYTLAIKGACTAGGIPPFTPGRFRHSVATWAIEKGADPASVAAFLNHKSPSTMRRFYATHAVPAKIPTLA